MKAIQYVENTSDLDKLTMVENLSKPVASPGYAVVAVKAASGNPVDYKVMHGDLKGAGWAMPLPFTPGYDAAGVIDGLSDEDKQKGDWKEGDDVFCVHWGQNKHDVDVTGKGDVDGYSPAGGAFAEYVKLPLSQLSKKPEGLGYDKAAAVALVGTTAHQALFDCLKVTKGSRVLILGGPTAVGALAIQMAKAAGAWVAATSSTRNLDYVNEFGPDLVINYREKDWAKDFDELRGIDAVLDAVGEADGFARAVTNSPIVKEGGGFCSIANFDAGFDPAGHRPRLSFGAFFCLYNNPKVQDELAARLVEGSLKIRIDKAFPFTAEGARDMLKTLEGGASKGKNVMVMG